MSELIRREDMRQLRAFELELRLMRTKDIDMVCSWRNHPDVLPFMRVPRAAPPLAMRFWFNKIRDDATVYPYIIFSGNMPVGYIETKDIDMAFRRCRRGIFLAHNCIGSGIGYAAELCRFVPADILAIDETLSAVNPADVRALRYTEAVGGSRQGSDVNWIYFRNLGKKKSKR